MSTIASDGLAAAESHLQARSALLRKDLGYTDLILASVLLVVIPDFFGTAVRAGSAHVVLWLVAIVLFFIPQVFVVTHLNSLMPFEGGLYEWTRLAFNDAIGFAVAWNLWLYAVFYVASAGLVVTNFIAYALGADAAAVSANKWLVLAASVACIAALMLLAHLGLRVGKWVTNIGSAFTILVITLLALLPFFHVFRGTLPGYHPLRLVPPPLTLFNLSVFSKMTFGALCGFEYAAIFAGESRNPGRHLSRAIFLTAPLIAFLYIFGTSAILAFVSPDSVDLIGPIPQALSNGLRGFAFGHFIVAIAIICLLTNYLSSFCLAFTANTRLPMVAGWDNLLPAWFTRLHQKYRTPVNSIFFLGGVTVAISAAVLIGVRGQESFEMLQIWGFTFYGLTYLVLFAIPLLARNELGIRPGLWLRIAAVSGFVVTLVFVSLSIFPIVDVLSRSAYAIKTATAIIGANVLGLVLRRLGRRKSVPRASAD